MSQIVFMSLAKGSKPEVHNALIKTPAYDLKVVVVPDYATAVKVAKKLAKEGTSFLELCAGFGHEGVALIKKAVPEVTVGVVRFDVHPGNNNESGDSTYGKRSN